MSIPLFAKENLVGILNLGQKRSGESFSTEDTDLLTIFSNNLAVAVENARLHTEILQTQKQLFQADKLKSLGTVAAGLAHEIKNPLTSIKGLSQLVKISHEENDESFFRQFDQIVPRQLDRINQLVERLNQFSKPPELKRSLTQINKLLEDTLGLFENKCKQQKIQIVKELETLPTLSADPDQLSQVFMNLIVNAIEAMPSGGTLKVKSYLFEKFNLAVEISDSGMGIPEEDLEHIFDPFFTTKPNGTGLGLSIVYQIIQEHQGSIEVKSKVGEGTSFKLTFKI
jgi:signal transduction histidine kinase